MSGLTDRFLRAWGKHENAPRTPCPECHFEQSEGYPPSHAPGCSRTCPGCVGGYGLADNAHTRDERCGFRPHEHIWRDTGFASVEDCAICGVTRDS